jgi:hypothetical protein
MCASKSVLTTARNLLSHDGPPPTPCTAADPLPIVPPPTRLTPSLLPRHYALIPLPPHPTLQQQTDASQTPGAHDPTHAQRSLQRLSLSDPLHVPTPVLPDAPRTVALNPTISQPRPQPGSPQVSFGRENVRLSTSRRLSATNQPSTASAVRPADHNNIDNSHNINNTTNSTHANTGNIF